MQRRQKKLEKNTQKYILKQEAKEQFISGDMTTEEILLQNNSFDETNQLCWVLLALIRLLFVTVPMK